MNNTTKHGHAKWRTNGTRTPEYRSWGGMLQRTGNPKNPRWSHYGGGGIEVCERWRSFENFLSDMGPRPAGTSLDRRDNDRGYSKENCRWATRAEQQRNRRVTRFVESDIREIKGRREHGETVCAIARRFDVNSGTISRVLSGVIWAGVE